MKTLLRVSRAARISFSPPLLRLAPVQYPLIAPNTQPQHRRYHAEEGIMGKEKFQLKVPKGTKDWEGKDMVIRDKIFSTITNVFKRHGAVTIDT